MISRRSIGPPSVPFVLNLRSQQARGLIAWYPALGSMGSMASALYDLSGNGLHGALTNLTQDLDAEFGSVLNWTGTGQYMSGSTTEMDFEYNTPFSWFAWLNYSNGATANRQTITGNGNVNPTAYRGWFVDLFVSNPNDMRVVLRSDSAANYVIDKRTQANVLTPGMWNLIGFTYAGNGLSSGLKLFVNGVELTSFATNTDNLGSRTIKTGLAYSLGRTGNYNVQYATAGTRIAENRIYKRVIDLSEAFQLWDPRTRWELYKPASRIYPVTYELTGEQTALEDARLDLSAYYQAMEDLGSWFRATDGIELEDLIADLSAWYQSLENAGLDVAAFYQSMEELAASFEASGWTLENVRSFLHAAALVYADMPADLNALGDARESLLAGLQAVAWAKHDLNTYLEAHSGLILLDLGACFEATDGTSFSNLGAWLCAIHKAPSFRSSVAQRASSVISAVTWPEVEDMGTYLHAAAWSRHDLGVELSAIAA